MKTILTVVLISACIGITGCKDAQIIEYAKRLETILGQYREGVQARLDSERALYDDLAEVFAGEAERDLYEGMKLERQRLGDRAATSLSATPPSKTPQAVIDDLRPLMEAEFTRTREFFEHEMTIKEKYTQGLARLSIDLQKLNVLNESLKAIEQQANLKTIAGDVGDFRDRFEAELGVQGCKDLERRLAIKKDSIADHQSGATGSTDAVKRLTAERDALDAQLKQLKTEKKCK